MPFYHRSRPKNTTIAMLILFCPPSGCHQSQLPQPKSLIVHHKRPLAHWMHQTLVAVKRRRASVLAWMITVNNRAAAVIEALTATKRIKCWNGYRIHWLGSKGWLVKVSQPMRVPNQLLIPVIRIRVFSQRCSPGEWMRAMLLFFLLRWRI